MGMHAGRVAVVTGAASGIGRAAAERIVAEGGSVVAVDRAADAFGWADGIDRMAVLTGDITDAAVNHSAVALAVERFGRLDAAVLNAGIPMSGDLLTMPMEQLQQVLAALMYAADLTEEYVEFNKGDVGDPASLGG